MDATLAADYIEREIARLNAFRHVADTLKQLGSLEQAIAERTARAKASTASSGWRSCSSGSLPQRRGQSGSVKSSAA